MPFSCVALRCVASLHLTRLGGRTCRCITALLCRTRRGRLCSCEADRQTGLVSGSISLSGAWPEPLSLVEPEPEVRSHRHRRSALATAPRIRCKEMVDMWMASSSFLFLGCWCVRAVGACACAWGEKGCTCKYRYPLNAPRKQPKVLPLLPARGTHPKYLPSQASAPV